MTASIMILSGFFGAISNFCMRRSMDQKGTAYAFFIFQLTFTCIVTIALYPLRGNFNDWNLPILALGLLGGLSLGLMKIFLGRALQKGPPGITFAAVNCASVMPAFIIVFAMGALIDYHLSFHEIIGSILVLIGLLWAGWDKSLEPQTRKWMLLAALAFTMHIGFLLVTELRAIFLNAEYHIGNPWMPTVAQMTSPWFVPMIFAAATGVHLFNFSYQENRLPVKSEVTWGIIGGIMNGFSAYLFVYGTEVATLAESCYIFSLFAVSLIICCNLWGQWLYREKVNWLANALCIAGLMIAA